MAILRNEITNTGKAKDQDRLASGRSGSKVEPRGGGGGGGGKRREKHKAFMILAGKMNLWRDGSREQRHGSGGSNSFPIIIGSQFSPEDVVGWG